ncbi:MAG TPA: sulfite exporter TauE/SafE family protein [Thermomicrobiales bacterium]|nr:sulfite exporter TauE/SafE family protein [Thermomicrobiales bacterium]
MALDAALIAALVIVILAGVTSGLTGFGFALISVPVLLVIYEPPAVVTLTMGLTFFTCLVIVASAWRSADVQVVLTMLPGTAAGLFAGAWLLALAGSATIKLVAGAVVVVFSLVLLRGVRLRGTHSRAAALLAGATSGALATMTGLSGPPAVMLLAARAYPPDAFRATIAAYFVALNVIGYAALLWQDLLTSDQLGVTAALLPAALLSTFAGTRLSRLVPPPMFRRLTLILLFLTGAIGAVTAVLALL